MLIGNNDLKNVVEEAAWEIDKNAKNDAEIIRGISEYLQRNVKYDYKMRNIRYHHEAYGALISHLAVCDGFAKAFKLIAEYLGFRCMVINGKKKDLSALFVGHAWNLIEYEGDFYHIDATWDTNIYEVTQEYSYSYLGLSDSEISIDHMWNIITTPKCSNTKLSYFQANNLIACSEGQITNILVRCLKQNERVIRLKVADGIALPSDEQSFMAKKVGEAMNLVSTRIGYSYTYSWIKEQRTFIVKFN